MTTGYRIGRSLLAVACLVALSLMQSSAFELSSLGTKWPGARAEIHTGIPGVSPSGIPWAEAFRDAAQEWSDSTAFEFISLPGYRNPCAGYHASGNPNFVSGVGDDFNGADFASTVCGDEFNNGTLAVTITSSELNILGSANMVEVDIIFNGNLNFDVYDGPLRPGAPATREYDFRRVALHELGHALGLGHEDSVPAIMASRVGNLFRLQDDDIAGANTLYKGELNCDNRPLSFGLTFDALKQGDCRVREIMVGGTDTSFVHLYRLQLADDLEVTFEANAAELDAVLLLAEPGLKLIALDENSAGNCDPRITMNLEAGEYLLLANTYSSNPPCLQESTGEGDYRLMVTYRSSQLLTLTGRESFQGGEADAAFFGGVTTDGGQTYHNRVSATKPFDVRGRIEIDPAHQGQSGYIVIAGITDEGETLIKNSLGHFVEYQPELQLVPVNEQRVLSEVEHIDVLTGMVAANIGIDQIEVNFFIGYGVYSNPDELYFHSTPINLIVEPD